MRCIIRLFLSFRYLALKCPLSKLRFTHISAHAACLGAWFLGLALAAIPLLPVHDPEWDFYSQSAICIPLPVSIVEFPGKKYAFAIFVILNFVLFLFIAIGQVVYLLLSKITFYLI